MRRTTTHRSRERGQHQGKTNLPSLACSPSLARHSPEINHARRDTLFEILVDFSFRTSLAVTLVSQLAKIDHHFFLDFIFQ
jgi:hypothetical protein